MQIEVYTFKTTKDIYADMAGQFFRASDDKPIKIIYHCGRIAVRDRNKIYGIKKLRANAVKSTKEIIDTPF